MLLLKPNPREYTISAISSENILNKTIYNPTN